MSEIFLDFEKPIVELKKKIRELQHYSEQNNIDMSAELAALEARVRQTREEIYSHLTPWQPSGLKFYEANAVMFLHLSL